MITLPCNHSVTQAGLQNNGLHLKVDSNTQPAHVQLTDQLNSDAWVCCPRCHNKVTGVASRRFFYPAVDLSPITAGDRSFTFKRVTLNNVLSGGEHSDDDGETYRRLAELSNDFKALTRMFGPVKGRMLYYLPTALKANAYIKGMQKAEGWTWLVSTPEGKTVGTFSLRKIETGRFNLSGEDAEKKIYNIGTLLHSDFQDKGIATILGRALLPQITNLELDIDAYWIAALPENAPVHQLAQTLGFQNLKTMDVTYENLTLGIWPGTLTQKLWIKYTS